VHLDTVDEFAVVVVRQEGVEVACADLPTRSSLAPQTYDAHQ
jgi:hypothetical protein